MGVYIPAQVRALAVWTAIQGDPTQVVFTKPEVRLKTGVTPATELPAQTVRISTDANVRLVTGEAGITPVREVKIFGVRDHPIVPNTNIEEGYTARLDGKTYRVSKVIYEPGEIRANAVVMG